MCPGACACMCAQGGPIAGASHTWLDKVLREGGIIIP